MIRNSICDVRMAPPGEFCNDQTEPATCPENSIALQVKGVDPQQEQQLSALPSFVQGDAWNHFKAGEQQIIIGKGVADALKVKQGDWVSGTQKRSVIHYCTGPSQRQYFVMFAWCAPLQDAADRNGRRGVIAGSLEKVSGVTEPC